MPNAIGTEELDDDEVLETEELEGDGEAATLPEGADENAEVLGEDEVAGADEQIAQAAAEGKVKGQPSRAQERIRRQQEELHRSREEKVRLETQLAELQRQQSQQNVQADQARQQQFMESLDPSERQAYMVQQQLEQMRREAQQAQFAQADATDKIGFQQRALQNQMVAKYVDRVEETLATMRSKGQTAPRESILKFLIGEEVLNKAPVAVKKATASAARAVSKPLRARGNAAPGGNSEDSDLEARLAKLTF